MNLITKNYHEIQNNVFKNHIMKMKVKHFISLFFVFAVMPFIVIAAPISHPSLIFNNITETQGYQHRSQIPWSDWERNVMIDANKALSKEFSDIFWKDRMKYTSQYTRSLGLAYQITKDPKYAEKAKGALLNIDLAQVPYPTDRTWGVRDYSLAYDWIQPYLNSSTDLNIRDKLAMLADNGFKDLTLPGPNIYNIGFADYHGGAYPNIGFAGLVLQDYTNPNKIPLSSTPSDWIKVGTEYLFVNDKLHNYGFSLFRVGFDEAGKHLDGGYKNYIINDYTWWVQAYSHFNSRNIFDDYPIVKNAFLSDIWESFPNYYSNTYCTSDNTKYFHQKGIINLLDAENKSYAMNYVDKASATKLLPYSVRQDPYIESALLYLVYGDYSSIQRKNPPWTSHLDPKSIYQVFRKNWNEDSDWLSLITFNDNTDSNREMAHQDQLSFEYYGKGDLLLADGGENKYVLDRYYGQYEIHHNTIAIEDPRKPFPLSEWGNSPARGIYKGFVTGLQTPVVIENLVQKPWIEFVDTKANINQVVSDLWAYSTPLSSPVQYERSVFYPNKENFIIVDRLKGSEPWIYRNIFRPTSFNIVPSTGTLVSQIGNVKGNLSLGGNPYNWLSLPYKKETATGITTNSIKWNTKNLYGNDVNLHLFSVPSSEILVTKHIGRVGGPDKESEVFQPLVYFRTASKNELYRITVLLSRYLTEEEKIPSELNVTGKGNALKVSTSKYQDYIYSGESVSSFDVFSTDAETVYVRKTGTPENFTLINGSYIKYSGAPLISLSQKVDYFTLTKQQNKTNFKIKGNGTVTITLSQINSGDSYAIKRDGLEYANWNMTSNDLIITTELSDHDFEMILISSNTSLKYDVNLDGKVDTLDQIAIAQNINEFPANSKYDMNNDVKIDIFDVIFIANNILA